ncbi:Lipoyl synthase OS=Streptomyces gougerotii OX=53448 GN=lipA PE=3 SV=1 [Streptomyces diastaticus subsp. diastaticus]
MSAVAPDGRKMLRLEVRNSQTPIERKPEWIKTRAKMGPEYNELQKLVKSEGLHTVCQEARLPQHLRVLGGPRGHLPHRR